MKNSGRVWVCSLALMFLIGGTLRANADLLWESSDDRGIPADMILRDNLNDEFGPATDKLIKMEEETPEANEERRVNYSEIPANNNFKDIKNVKLKINSIIFTGNTVFTSSQLDELKRDLQGKEISSQDLAKIADEITALYKEKGYITSRAYFDPKNVNNGVAEIKIIEGRVGDINIKDNKWVRTSYIRNNLLKADDIKEDKIFNINDLSTSLNKDDYLKGEVTLQENKTNPEKTDLLLKIKDRFPVGVDVTYDDLGRSTVGTQRARLNFEENNLTGFGDKLYANTIFARRTFGLNTGYNFPIGPYGTELRLGYSFVRVGEGGFWSPWEVDSTAHLLEPL